jgi:hypothetical protein
MATVLHLSPRSLLRGNDQTNSTLPKSPVYPISAILPFDDKEGAIGRNEEHTPLDITLRPSVNHEQG